MTTIDLIELQKNAARYEIIRKLNPRQFTELYRANMWDGRSFDDVVDELVARAAKNEEKA